jgi:4-hydroxy 2-oxovalerate aldolase
MDPLKILDVTLRDGGHINNFHFKNEDVVTIIKALDISNIEYIEVGYKNGSISPIDNIGIAGLSPDEYLLLCKNHVTKAKIAVMAHCKNINKDDIKALKKCGVSLLRLCIPKGEHQVAYPFIKLAKDEGLLVSINLIHISQYKLETIFKVVESIVPYEPTMIYFADSNGCLHPERVTAMYEYCTSNYQIPFGYHGHDNIGLAQMNTLAAIAAGAVHVDASLAGAGKGIGNLKMEYFIAYLQSNKIHRYEILPLIEASNFVRNILKCGYVSEDEFTRGILDLSTEQLKSFKTTNQKGIK